MEVDVDDGIITLRFELAHRTVIGVHRNLFFVVDFEESGMLFNDLVSVSYVDGTWKWNHPTRLESTLHRPLLIEAIHLIVV